MIKSLRIASLTTALHNGILPHTLEPYLGFYQTSKPCGNDITSELMDFKTSGEATSFEIH